MGENHEDNTHVEDFTVEVICAAVDEDDCKVNAHWRES